MALTIYYFLGKKGNNRNRKMLTIDKRASKIREKALLSIK